MTCHLTTIKINFKNQDNYLHFSFHTKAIMTYDIVIIGAGIVGPAVGLKLFEKRPGAKILLLEKEARPGSHQTGNNSGVIHSGIYCRPGSLKAQNCRKGYKLLIDFCQEHDIRHEICGKLIVAVEKSELAFLDELYNRGVKNGLTGLKRLDSAGIRDHEPHVSGLAGIQVPQTGIIDFRKVAQKMVSIIAGRGGEVRTGEQVHGLRPAPDGMEVVTDQGGYQTRFVVNCGGLWSDRIARMTHPDLPVRIVPFRGEYYRLRHERRSLVRSLVYPVPDPAFPFLGVHFTRMISGEVEAGPNAVLAFKRDGYKKSDFSLRDTLEAFMWPGFRIIARRYWRSGLGEFHRSLSKKAFVHALQRLLPEVLEEDLSPGGAGVRAQACSRDGRLLDDFYFVEGPRVLHVCNAPSPAATASLAIGEQVADLVLSRS